MIDKKIQKHILELMATGKFGMEQSFIQHGTTTVLDHSIQVAIISLAIARWLPFHFHEDDLIRGALLHDYFLYDWHDKTKAPSFPHLHGYVHPTIAKDNAIRDYHINLVEQNIIERHMFPLTLFHPPGCREAWVVCLADKYCATKETIRDRFKAHQSNRNN